MHSLRTVLVPNDFPDLLRTRIENPARGVVDRWKDEVEGEEDAIFGH